MERDWLVEAFLTLRAHGRALCRRAAPICMACPPRSGLRCWNREAVVGPRGCRLAVRRVEEVK